MKRPSAITRVSRIKWFRLQDQHVVWNRNNICLSDCLDFLFLEQHVLTLTGEAFLRHLLFVYALKGLEIELKDERELLRSEINLDLRNGEGRRDEGTSCLPGTT